MQTTPVLAIPDKTGTFVLDTDASDKAIGAELIQIQNGLERVVAYGSFTLSPAQGRYCTTRLVRFTQHFKHYLLGREFILRTDHNSLRWLINFKDLQGQLARWLEVLSQYSMQIQHRSGNKHVNATSYPGTNQKNHVRRCPFIQTQKTCHARVVHTAQKFIVVGQHSSQK